MNILLIPTTDNVINNIKAEYINLAEKGNNIYIITDNNLINNKIPNEFKKIDLYLMRLYQKEQLNSMKKFIMTYYLNLYAMHILKEYKIDFMVVSNDNPFVQNIFVNIAKNLNIKTVLHQASSISFKPKRISLLKKIFINIKKVLFNNTSGLNIGENVDFHLIQGDIWKSYLVKDKSMVIGNSYYRQLSELSKDIDIKDIDDFKKQFKGKKIVTIFSQPFNEVDKFDFADETQVKELYDNFIKLGRLNKNIQFIFKPHPQDKYYKDFDFKDIKVIEKVELNLLLKSSDFTISCFSTMAIQSALLNKVTLGYLPEYFSDAQKNRMKDFFDFTSNNIEILNQTINEYLNGNIQKKKHLINSDIVDLSKDTVKIVEDFYQEKK